MGCFNVACSVSNLSISVDTEVAFIPLLPSNYDYRSYESGRKKNLIPPRSMILYPNDYFNPLCLPIVGKYNDYGALEDITKNANTERIEEVFGIPIESFVEIISEDRDIADSFGRLFDKYGINNELLSSYDVKFNRDFLISFGFKEKMKENKEGDLVNLYQFGDLPYYIRLTEINTKDSSQGHGFEIIDEGFNVIGKNDGYDSRRSLIKMFRDKTGYILNVAEENQFNVTLIQQLSGMFVNYEIYKTLSEHDLENASRAGEDITEDILFSLGFENKEENIYKRESSDYLLEKEDYGYAISANEGEKLKHWIISSMDLAKEWEIFTNEKLDISFLTKQCKYDDQYEEYRNFLLGDFSDNPIIIKLEKELKEAEEKNEDEDEIEILKSRIRMFKKTVLNDPMFSNSVFQRFFEKWKYFGKFYYDAIKEGELKEEFKQYIGFYYTMYSCNRFFFPGMNGEQHGNQVASRVLLEKSLEILTKEDEEMDDY